jgi:hypothetical protein
MAENSPTTDLQQLEERVKRGLGGPAAKRLPLIVCSFTARPHALALLPPEGKGDWSVVWFDLVPSAKKALEAGYRPIVCGGGLETADLRLLAPDDAPEDLLSIWEDETRVPLRSGQARRVWGDKGSMGTVPSGAV